MSSLTKIIAIGSGKGGVGKSTVTANIAMSLAKKGKSVGLIDADLYGPSIPLMFGLRDLSPQEINGQVIPITKFGVQLISIGFFLEEARSIVWRGPMLHGALEKMIKQVAWGELDYLLIDLPPGTGDIPISLSKLLKIDGGIIVTTPQECAILDAIKAIHSFDQLNIPLLGIIENMAGFKAPDTGLIHHIFGEGKAEELAHRIGAPLLGSLPLLPEIRLASDEGRPAHEADFTSIAQKLL